MARDSDNPGHAAARPALRSLEFAAESHHHQQPNDRVRETLLPQLFRKAIRSIPPRRNPRPNGAVIPFLLQKFRIAVAIDPQSRSGWASKGYWHSCSYPKSITANPPPLG